MKYNKICVTIRMTWQKPKFIEQVAADCCTFLGCSNKSEATSKGTLKTKGDMLVTSNANEACGDQLILGS